MPSRVVRRPLICCRKLKRGQPAVEEAHIPTNNQTNKQIHPTAPHTQHTKQNCPRVAFLSGVFGRAGPRHLSRLQLPPAPPLARAPPTTAPASAPAASAPSRPFGAARACGLGMGRATRGINGGDGGRRQGRGGQPWPLIEWGPLDRIQTRARPAARTHIYNVNPPPHVLAIGPSPSADRR